MLTLKEKVHNLETIIQKKNFSSEHEPILLIKRNRKIKARVGKARRL